MNLTEQGIAEATRLLISAHRERTQLTELPAQCAPRSIADAYVIQDRVAQALWLSEGERTSCWKAGAASRDETPYVAPIPPAVIEHSPAVLAADDFHMIGVEAELAYRLGCDLPVRERPYTEAEVAAAIAGVVVTIEVVDTRLHHWREAGALWQLADNQINGALVIGDGRSDWRNIQVSQQAAELYVDGEVVVSNIGSHPVGDPTCLLTSAVNQCADRNDGLQTGDLITAGTWTGLQFVKPGAEVEARFPGIGAARVRFTA